MTQEMRLEITEVNETHACQEWLTYRFLQHAQFYKPTDKRVGPRWRSWLRHYATNRQVAGSIPDGGIILSVALWSWGRLSL
jgi:hypothetical protein